MLDRDVQLIYELGCLRNIQRAWRQFTGEDVANLAEHHFRVAWIALLLAAEEGAGNHEKILKMALVHDVGESRTGDVHYVSRLYTQRDESAAIKDTFDGTSLGKELVDLWHEYEKYESIEAQIVKDADNLEFEFELHEMGAKGNLLEKKFRKGRDEAVRSRLYTESGRKMWDAIAASDPHDWHTNGKNRITAGDWSKPVAEKEKEVNKD